MQGYKLIIPGKPQTYQAGQIEYKPKPHVLPHKDIVDYREHVRQCIHEIYNEDFKFNIPVELEIIFYHPSNRLISTAGCTQVIVAALTPHLIQHSGLAKRIITESKVDTKNPRTEITIRPLL